MLSVGIIPTHRGVIDEKFSFKKVLKPIFKDINAFSPPKRRLILIQCVPCSSRYNDGKVGPFSKDFEG